mmetsp:Transcript_15351/g.24017  ORF Transcript_15351/g.24017 Transcript_15351/m.24017 type:complete len:261 (-) Transcript_15351:28-810(-)
MLQELWSQHVQYWGDTVTSRVIIPWVIMMFVFWFYSLFFFLLDYFHVPDFIYKRKHQPSRPLRIEGCSYQPPLVKALKLILFNQFFVILPGLLWVDRWTRSGFLLPDFVVGVRMEEELPDWQEIAVTIVKAVISTEVCFFYSHYLLHHPKLYGPIHKVHHEFKATTGMAAIYAHPVEAFIGNTMAVMAPAFFLNFHGFSWYLSMVVGWMKTIEGHSGYSVPWNFGNNFHDLHHEHFNYNFGTFSVLDRLHGTVYKPKKTE